MPTIYSLFPIVLVVGDEAMDRGLLLVLGVLFDPVFEDRSCLVEIQVADVSNNGQNRFVFLDIGK